MTGKPSLVDEIEALVPLHLEGLREIWRDRFGAPPKLRSAELLRHCMAWRLQAEALAGLDGDTRRQLKRRQRLRAEGLDLGIGTMLRREWRGRIIQVTVEEEGFRHGGRLFKSWTLLTKVETSCDRILIAGGANVEAEWEQGPAV